MTQHKHSAVVVLLERGISQHEIQRKTGIDRKTIRKIAQSMADGPSNSPMATLLLHGPLGKVSLNPAEAALLVGLLRSPKRMLDVYQISALMGQKEEAFNQASLVVRIVRLRKKLIEIGAERDCIKPQRMAGYQLCIPLEIR